MFGKVSFALDEVVEEEGDWEGGGLLADVFVQCWEGEGGGGGVGFLVGLGRGGAGGGVYLGWKCIRIIITVLNKLTMFSLSAILLVSDNCSVPSCCLKRQTNKVNKSWKLN